MAFKNNENKNDSKVAFTTEVMKNSQLMDYMVSLHFIDFISLGVLDTGPLYCSLYYTLTLFYHIIL
jgi:hypothetical protein